MSESPQIHLICNAHLDPIWQWNWEEGLTEAMATFEVAADLLDEYPEFVFNHNESVLYEWTYAHRPDLFDRIRKHVASGRWVISGGWYLQPDCNLPCGESFVRQTLIGRAFFRKHFGVSPKVAYNLDPFGHHANLPQILRQTGYEMYVHYRPLPGEKELPSFLYRWRGIDGSEIAALRPPCGAYNHASPEHLKEKIGAMRALAAEVGHDVTAFWGAGDHGGGASRADLDAAREVAAAHPEVKHSSFETYCGAVAGNIKDAPVVEGEIQKCFTGCYTSVIGGKQRNRRGEGLALAAERYAALAWWLLGKPYPAEELDGIWKTVLFNQFHDILPGSSVREGYRGSIELYGHAFTHAREVVLRSQLALAQTKKRREPLAVCLFNPQAIARKVPVEIEFMGAHMPHQLEGKTFELRDARGRLVPYQLLRPGSAMANWRKRMLFDAALPALGMAEYRIEVVDGHEEKGKPGVRVRREKNGISFSATYYSLRVNTRTGLVDSLRDKTSGRELLAKPGGALEVRQDTAHAWGPNDRPYGKVVGKFRCPLKRDLSDIVGAHGDPYAPPVRLIEAGPIAARFEVIQAWGRSTARLRYTLYADAPQIGLELLVNWNERRRALQLAFPTALDSGRYTVEIPHGALERPTGNSEEPCGRWAMLASSDGKTAFALVNDGPGGVDVNRGELRQSLVRSPIFSSFACDVPPDHLSEHMDLGEHVFRFVLRLGAAAEVRSDLPLLADDLMMPPNAHVHIPLGPCPEAGLEPDRNVVEVKGKGVHLAALKRSEDGKGLIARLVETGGRSRRAQLRVPGLRRPAAVRFRPYEIKTIRISRTEDGCVWRECNLLEQAGTGSAKRHRAAVTVADLPAMG